jgi:hypothetical protein
MHRTYVSFIMFMAVIVSSLAGIAEAAPNPGILYSDHSYNYAVGYPNLDFPTVYVGRGQMCLITINRGEELNVKDNVPVIVADRTHWTVIGSRSGGQRLPNGETVPVTWGVAVQPAQDADDTWLTINTAMGNRYIVHLVAVARHSSLGEQLVGFYLYHPPHHVAPPRVVFRRQAVRPQTVSRQSVRRHSHHRQAHR